MASIQEEKYRVGKRPQCSFFEAELARIILVLILLAMTPMAYAQSCTFNWTGTWDSRYGELRLIQSGSNVYGDYASVGTLKSTIYSTLDDRGICTSTLRGIFERTNGQWGYIEFIVNNQAPSVFEGRWNYASAGEPSNDMSVGTVWNGNLVSPRLPVLTMLGVDDDKTPFTRSDPVYHQWLKLVDLRPSQPRPNQPSMQSPDNCDSYWTDVWDTRYGQLRLIQDGNLVYGDYTNKGTIKAYVDKPCGGGYLRGIFENKGGKWGYIEFVATGDLEQRFSGRWTWSNSRLPSWKDKIGTEWWGTRKNMGSAPITNFSNSESRDPALTVPSYLHSWLDLIDIRGGSQKRAKQLAQEEDDRHKAEVEAHRNEIAQAEAMSHSQKEAEKLVPVTSGLALNDGYASVLSVDTNFDHNKFKTLVSMQEHIQMVSEVGADTVLDLLAENNFVVLGGNIIQRGGAASKRLRAYVVRKDRAIIVAFRGTKGDNFGETVANAIISDGPRKLVPPDFINLDNIHPSGDGLLVHTGFLDSYNKLKRGIFAALDDEPVSNLFIFGHSLGAAMATLMALDIQENHADKFATVTHMVSGSPRVGNRPFSRYFSRKVKDSFRFVLNHDPIIMIPRNGGILNRQRKEKYVHAGRLLAINENAKPISGKDIDLNTPARFKYAMEKYHANTYYLDKSKLLLNNYVIYPVLSPSANNWINTTAKDEMKRN